MKKKTPVMIALLLVPLIAGLAGCDMLIFTPFGSTGDKYHNLNARNLAKIMEEDDGAIPFKVAFIADTHLYYRQTAGVIKNLNRRGDIDFLMVVGDITEQGLLHEYEWSVDVFTKSRCPFLVVIGNHDALTFGQDIYRDLFGKYNFNFTYKSVDFVCFNDNKWEFRSGVPDFTWLENAVSGATSPLSLLACHIPWLKEKYGTFTTAEIELFESIVTPVISLTVHGHFHDPHEQVEGGVPRYIAGSPENGNCLIVTFHADHFEVERCNFL